MNAWSGLTPMLFLNARVACVEAAEGSETDGEIGEISAGGTAGGIMTIGEEEIGDLRLLTDGAVAVGPGLQEETGPGLIEETGQGLLDVIGQGLREETGPGQREEIDQGLREGKGQGLPERSGRDLQGKTNRVTARKKASAGPVLLKRVTSLTGEAAATHPAKTRNRRVAVTDLLQKVAADPTHLFTAAANLHLSPKSPLIAAHLGHLLLLVAGSHRMILLNVADHQRMITNHHADASLLTDP